MIPCASTDSFFLSLSLHPVFVSGEFIRYQSRDDRPYWGAGSATQCPHKSLVADLDNPSVGTDEQVGIRTIQLIKVQTGSIENETQGSFFTTRPFGGGIK